MTISREICLASRPVGMPAAENFALANRELAAPGAGEVLVQNKYMSVDPYMRGRMYDRPSYVPPFQIGEALQGGAIGMVVESNAEGLRKGDIVSSMFGWREAFVAPAAALEKLDVPGGIPMESFLGVLGMPGLTAWAGLTQIGKPKPGDVVFVSGAAGAVGSIVAQVAKLKGCTVVASAGSDDKCAWLKSLGIDRAGVTGVDRVQRNRSPAWIVPENPNLDGAVQFGELVGSGVTLLEKVEEVIRAVVLIRTDLRKVFRSIRLVVAYLFFQSS